MNLRPVWCPLFAVLIILAMGACVDEVGPDDTGNPFAAPPALVAVSPVDAYHVDVTFSKLLDLFNTESRNNYVLEALSPLAPIAIVGVDLKNDEKTIRISTGTSMAGINCRLTVISLADRSGNSLARPIVKSFTGSTAADATTPLVTYRYPSPGQTNVALGQVVIFKFSEGMAIASISGGVSWSSDQGPVTFNVTEYHGSFSLTPSANLASNSLQTIRLTGIQDPAGNTMADVEWSFTTGP